MLSLSSALCSSQSFLSASLYGPPTPAVKELVSKDQLKPCTGFARNDEAEMEPADNGESETIDATVQVRQASAPRSFLRDPEHWVLGS
ncbi:hypothetical protein BDV93DRAFT_554579 [Ceratobasidium sp. AG-I]|nr:hypothetical protein BDV93DRAFT_554579 [Ceratobasidium sp. AG-I]